MNKHDGGPEQVKARLLEQGHKKGWNDAIERVIEEMESKLGLHRVDEIRTLAQATPEVQDEP